MKHQPLTPERKKNLISDIIANERFRYINPVLFPKLMSGIVGRHETLKIESSNDIIKKIYVLIFIVLYGFDLTFFFFFFFYGNGF